VPTGKKVVDLAMKQKGKPYRFGVEVKLGDPNPKAFDCSELTQWVCHQLRVKPEFPDGSGAQYEHCKRHGLEISLEDAITTPGALLFHIGKHVAISRGDGKTIEARGKDYGVGIFSATKGREFDAAGLIPGVDYGEEWA
jgi:cell wall-associated NlpC family hydrolase